MIGQTRYAPSDAMFYISPMTLTIVSGILSASSGAVWFLREKPER
jgi:hypothetical protein